MENTEGKQEQSSRGRARCANEAKSRRRVHGRQTHAHGSRAGLSQQQAEIAQHIASAVCSPTWNLPEVVPV